MRLVLEVRSGQYQGKRIEAGVGRVVSVGRTPKADVVLEDNFLSGAHFAIECDLQGCRLRDLNSRNGTKLNGETVIEAVLNEGDQVHAGQTDFIVRIEDPMKTVRMAAPESDLPAQKARSSGPQSQELSPAPGSLVAPLPSGKESPKPEASSEPEAPRATDGPDLVSVLSASERVPAAPIQSIQLPSPPAQVILPSALAGYEAATPDGRLLQILSSQPEPLMALIDSTSDSRVLELLRGTSEEYQSLYSSERSAAIAPYLVRLPPQSELLKQMVKQGWGQEWGVYLTCSLSLSQLRDYFRSSLMVTMPDGMELVSRFYDPRFFRGFLETCSAAEAECFFGPITSYLMEDERAEILLQFKRSKTGTKKKGHLLSVLA